MRIYENHHSYLPERRLGWTVTHHGIYFENKLVGGITYAYPPVSVEIGGIDPTKCCEVARVAVGIECPNLASCSMAKSQDKFVVEMAPEHGFELLVTWIRDDYDGSMFKALRDKGWTCDRISTPSPPGNRPTSAINNRTKQRWICHIDPPDSESPNDTQVGLRKFC